MLMTPSPADAPYRFAHFCGHFAEADSTATRWLPVTDYPAWLRFGVPRQVRRLMSSEGDTASYAPRRCIET